MTDTGIYLNNITDGSVMNEKTATTTNNSQSLTSTPKFNWSGFLFWNIRTYASFAFGPKFD